jgi:hypothetical protein
VQNKIFCFFLIGIKWRLKMESKTSRTDAEFKLEAFFDGVGIAETVLVEFARQLETELADKDKQLAEARAEIENLHWRVSDEQAKTRAALELNSKALELVNEARAEIERKNAIIGQMREALKAIDGIGREAGNARREDALRCFAIAAAALAVERGK